MESTPGLFISLDGVDGSGKSTQIQLLCDWFRSQGREVMSVRDPGGTPLGEALRDVLLHRQEIPLAMSAEMLLYMASRAQLVAEIIRPALEQGKVVVADRFLLSNAVYQGTAGGMDVDAIWRVGKVATGGLEPHLTVVLDIAPDIASQRIDRALDRLESRGLEYMRAVRKGFLTESQRLFRPAHIVDASRPVAEVQAEIILLVEAYGRAYVEPNQ